MNEVKDEIKREKLEYILGRKKFKSVSLPDIDDDLLDILYNRFKNKDKKIKSLRKENDQYSDMKLCTKKGGCKHSVGSLLSNPKIDKSFSIMNTEAFERVMRAHFILDNRRPTSKYTISDEFTIFALSCIFNEEKALEYARNIGMSKKTMISHQQYMTTDFIPKITSYVSNICGDEIMVMQFFEPIRILNTKFLCGEYIKTVTGYAYNDEDIDKITNEMLRLLNESLKDDQAVTK